MDIVSEFDQDAAAHHQARLEVNCVLSLSSGGGGFSRNFFRFRVKPSVRVDFWPVIRRNTLANTNSTDWRSRTTLSSFTLSPLRLGLSTTITTLVFLASKSLCLEKAG